MSDLRELNVYFNADKTNVPVGRLALAGRDLYFEYDDAWIKSGRQLSPVYLPLKNKLVKIPAGLSNLITYPAYLWTRSAESVLHPIPLAGGYGLPSMRCEQAALIQTK